MITLLATLLLGTSDPMPAPPMVSVEESTGSPCTTADECGRGLSAQPQPKMVQRATATSPARFKLSGEVPEGFHVVSELHLGLLGAGISIFAISYLGYGLFGTAMGSPETLIPFVGPILAYRPSTGWFSGVADFFSVVGIAIDVMAQLGSASMLLVALTVPKRWLERDVDSSTTPTISFAPMAPGAELGASVMGRF